MRNWIFGFLISLFFLAALPAHADAFGEWWAQQPHCHDANGVPQEPLAIDKEGKGHVTVKTPSGELTTIKLRRPYGVVCGNHLFKSAEKNCDGDKCRFDPKPREARHCKRKPIPNRNRICEHILSPGKEKRR